MSLELVDAPTGVHVVASFAVVKQCPFKGEQDTGAVHVEWVCNEDKSIELHSLKEFFYAFRDRSLSHEAFITETFDAIDETGMNKVRVKSTWQHGEFVASVALPS